MYLWGLTTWKQRQCDSFLVETVLYLVRPLILHSTVALNASSQFKLVTRIIQTYF